MMTKNFFLFLLILVMPLKAFASQARQEIYFTGSSTISPLIATISEEFSRKYNSPLPILESTGTITGFEIFCQGSSLEYPDFVNASEKITQNEIDLCNQNKVYDIVEIKIGYDGIVIGNSIKSTKVNFKLSHIFLALAEKVIDPENKKLISNPYHFWSDIDASLPKIKIKFFLPPSSSATRMVFAELLMEKFCMNDKNFIDVINDDQERQNQCHKIRNDDHIKNNGENDEQLITLLQQNKNAFGIFGYHFLFANKNKIQAVKIDGIEPNLATISAKRYQLSRPLFIYLKRSSLTAIPEIKLFLKELISEDAIGQKGYLTNSGLIPMNKKELREVKKSINKKVMR